MENQTIMKDIDVLAVDGIDVDWLFKMSKLPSFDQKLSAEFMGCFPGGPVGNFACIGSNLGLKVAIMCTLGTDEGGKLLEEDFTTFGVDTSYISFLDAHVTPFVIVIVDPTGEKAVIVPDLPDPDQATISDNAIARSKYVYMNIKNYNKFIQIAQIARQSNTKIMVDLETSRSITQSRIHEILEICDIVSFNEQGFTAIFDKAPDIDSLSKLIEEGPEIVIVTRGNRGVLGVTSTEVIDIPAFKVDVKDTTGAGDTFNASFLYSKIRGDAFARSLLVGSAAAAIVIQTIGTRTSLPTETLIEELLIKTMGEKQ